MIPFLSLKDVTALHGGEINAAVTRVVNSGWYLQGVENKCFEENYVEVYVSYLRKKLKTLKSKVQIKTIRGLGYKLCLEN